MVVSAGVGGRRRRRRRRTRTRTTIKESKEDTIRHDKETDQYGRTDAASDHDYYLFCGEDQRHVKKEEKIRYHTIKRSIDSVMNKNKIARTHKERGKDPV